MSFYFFVHVTRFDAFAFVVNFFAFSMFAASQATSFELLLVLRFIQGIGAAAIRITTLAIVRDCFGGREMARVMSYVMIVFMIVPIVAPSMGQVVILYASWHWIFTLIGCVGSVLFLWALTRMKESLPREERLPLSVRSVLSGFRTVLTNRITCGYMIGLTLFTAVICAYIVSVQQVFGEIYGLADWLPIAFAGTAGGIAVAAAQDALLGVDLGELRLEGRQVVAVVPALRRRTEAQQGELAEHVSAVVVAAQHQADGDPVQPQGGWRGVASMKSPSCPAIRWFSPDRPARGGPRAPPGSGATRDRAGRRGG